MTTVPGSLLVTLAVIAAVVTGSPLSVVVPDSSSPVQEMVAAMTQMADNFLHKNNENSDSKEPEANFEMRVSGFTGVIKTRDSPHKESAAHSDPPAALGASDPPAAVWQRVEDPTHEGYEKLGEGSYKFHTDGADWPTAKDTCEREGAHLVVINSEEEAQLMGDLFARHPNPNAFYRNQIWVGVNDIQEEGKFVTVLGDDLSTAGYASWGEGQPDDWKVDDPKGEDCVTMRQNKKLNDVHCSANIAFVCEVGQAVFKPTPQSEVSPAESGETDTSEQRLEASDYFEYQDSDEQEQTEYVELGEGRYKFHVDGADWPTAKDTCEREGAHLVVINSEEEAQLMGDLFARYPRPHAYYPDQIWVGVNDIAEEGHFVTVLGDDLTAAGYDTWYDNQPDDWKVTNPSGEDCVTMRRDKTLNDVHCSANMAFVCEAGDDETKSTTPSETETKSTTTSNIEPTESTTTSNIEPTESTTIRPLVLSYNNGYFDY